MASFYGMGSWAVFKLRYLIAVAVAMTVISLLVGNWFKNVVFFVGMGTILAIMVYNVVSGRARDVQAPPTIFGRFREDDQKPESSA